MSALTRFLGKRKEKQDKKLEPDSKLYRTLNLTAIIGIFVIVTVLIISIFGYIKMRAWLFGILCTMAMACVGLLLCLPWVKRFEKNDFKKTAIVFMSFVAVCTLLWIICVWLGVGVYKKIGGDGAEDEFVKSLIKTLNFIKITLILSVQLMVASVVGTCITKFRKTMLAFQGVTYLSYLFLDFYLTFFLACIQINTETNKIDISNNISLLGNKFMIMMLVLMLAFVAISNIIINRSQERHAKEYVDETYRKSVDEKPTVPVEETAEDKLAKLKNMYEKELITKEEYEQKRSDILKDM